MKKIIKFSVLPLLVGILFLSTCAVAVDFKNTNGTYYISNLDSGSGESLITSPYRYTFADTMMCGRGYTHSRCAIGVDPNTTIAVSNIPIGNNMRLGRDCRLYYETTVQITVPVGGHYCGASYRPWPDSDIESTCEVIYNITSTDRSDRSYWSPYSSYPTVLSKCTFDCTYIPYGEHSNIKCLYANHDVTIQSGQYIGAPALNSNKITVNKGQLVDKFSSSSKFTLGEDSEQTVVKDETNNTTITTVKLSNPPIIIDWADFPG